MQFKTNFKSIVIDVKYYSVILNDHKNNEVDR